MASLVQRGLRRLKNLVIDRADLVDRGANDGAKVVLFKRDGGAPHVERSAFAIIKKDDAQHIVYGWGSVVVQGGGDALVTDRQGDQIDPATLEQAVEQFMLGSDEVFDDAAVVAASIADGTLDEDEGTRAIQELLALANPSGVMHEGQPTAKVVASFVTTPDIMRAFFGDVLGADACAQIPIGWMLGVKVYDEATWQRVLNGELTAFSIQGTADPADDSDGNDDTTRKRQPQQHPRRNEARAMATTVTKRDAAQAVIEKRARALKRDHETIEQAINRVQKPPSQGGDPEAFRAVKAYQDAAPGDMVEAGVGQDVEPQDTDTARQLMLQVMQKLHDDLGQTLGTFGDASKLPGDSPVHRLAALHKELGRQIASRGWMGGAAAGEGGGDDLDKSTATPYGRSGHPGVAKSAGWKEIEAEADKIVAKGERGMTKEKARNLVMKKRPDLVDQDYREAHGYEPYRDPATRR